MMLLYQRFDVVCSICRRVNIKDGNNYVVIRREFVATYLIIRKDAVEEGDIILYPTEE